MKISPAVIGLVTADMARSLQFYRDLGLPIPQDADVAPHVDVEVSEGLSIAWDTYDTVRVFDPEWTPSSGGPAMALCFACDSPSEVDDVFARMVAAGHVGHRPPWDAVWRQRYAVLHDPDGNSVELFAAL